MIIIDGKMIDLTNPASWGSAITIMPGGSITTFENGISTQVVNTQKPADSQSDKPKGDS